MRKIWFAVLVLVFLLALTAAAASADGPALSTDGAGVSFTSAADSYYVQCRLTVTTSGKVTIRCLENGQAGQFGVLTSWGDRYILEQASASSRTLYLNQDWYWLTVYTGGAKQVFLSATVEPISGDTEPNDLISTAQQVALPGSFGGMIGSMYDTDTFKFTVAARTGWTFAIDCTDKAFPACLYLYDAGGSYLGKPTSTPSMVLDAGDYFLGVGRENFSSDGKPFTTAYTVRVATFRPVSSLTVSPETAQMEVGQTLALKATTLPADNDETVSFMSGDPSVATVTSAGLVTAVKPGAVNIICSVPSGPSAVATITVLRPEATSYKLPKTCKATRGFIYSMYSWINLPDGTRAPSGLTWSSSKKSVAAITPDGILTCNKLGTTKITATNRSGKKFTTTLTVISNQLKNNRPRGKSGYLSSYPKRVYYQGNSLCIEVFLYNNTKYNLRTDIYDGYIFELYDLAKSTASPVVSEYVGWNPGRIKKHSWKVFKIQLNRSLYDNCDLGLGQLYPLIYTEDDFYIVKGIRIDNPTLRKIGIEPRRRDEPSDFM